MNCEEARLHVGAEPHALPPELAEHLRECPACAEFHREMSALDANIRRVLELPPDRRESTGETRDEPGSERQHASAPEAGAITGSSSVVPLRRRPVTAWSGWAMAASVLIAVSVLAIWALRPTTSLAHEVVAHVQEEPLSWGSTEPVSNRELDSVLRAAGIALEMNTNRVVYAQSCMFRGHRVPHLVVGTSHGPVTVLVLRYEHVKARERFHEDGMSGVLATAPHGSIAVLAEGNTNIDEVAEQMRTAVRWLDEPAR